MNENRLKMNNSKTEVIFFGSRQHLLKCNTTSINVNGEDISRGGNIKYLGAVLDEQLNLKQHITNKSRIAMYNLHRIKLIRRSLTKASCHTLVRGLVLSHLDYANAIVVGLPNISIRKLQKVQNAAARLIHFDRDVGTTAMMKDLHWLPIRQRIHHKILTLVFKCLTGTAPQYLQDLIIKRNPTRPGLRSNTKHNLLHVPSTNRKTLASRSFSVTGPFLWNELPDDARTCDSLSQFKRKLKTILFAQAYA